MDLVIDRVLGNQVHQIVGKGVVIIDDQNQKILLNVMVSQLQGYGFMAVIPSKRLCIYNTMMMDNSQCLTYRLHHVFSLFPGFFPAKS